MRISRKIGFFPSHFSMARTTPGFTAFSVFLQPAARHTARDFAFGKQSKDVSNSTLDLTIRILGDLTRLVTHITHRKRSSEFTSLGFVPTSIMKTAAKGKKFCLGDRTFHPKKEPVVGFARIIDGTFISKQGLRYHTDFDQSMPVGIGTCQPRCLQS